MNIAEEQKQVLRSLYSSIDDELEEEIKKITNKNKKEEEIEETNSTEICTF